MNSAGKHGRVARWSILVLVNIAGATLLLEIGARLVYPIARPDPFTWAEIRSDLSSENRDEAVVISDPVAAPPGTPIRVIHPYLGYVMKPSPGQSPTSSGTLPLSDFGFFGEAPLLDPTEGDFVVAIAGGSVAASFWHHEAGYIRDRLSADPRFRGKTIHVQSFALGGFKQPQMLNTLVYLLTLGAHVDIWIELDGFNDLVLPVAENVPTGIALEFPRRWDKLAGAQVSPQEAVTRLALSEERTTRESRRKRVAHSPWMYSAFALAWWDTLDRASAARIEALVRSLNAGADRFAVPSPEDELAALRTAAGIWKNASLQLSRLCEANGIVYLQFVQPNQYFPDSKPFSEEEQRTALARGGYRPAAEKGYTFLMEAADGLRSQGVTIQDLTMLFADEPRTVYRDSCCHVNELGNRLMADKIVEAILAAGGGNP